MEKQPIDAKLSACVAPEKGLRGTQIPIAVIGMACRLPGNCNSPTDFWKFLLDGGIASCEVPDSRFSISGHYDGSGRPSTMRSPGGMCLNIDPRDIDAGFFGLSQVDAVSMDPNQRQLLEVVYEGLENAGLTLESLKKKSYGCFVGSYASDYSDIQSRDPENRTPSCTVGNARAMLSNRISHFLDITGPSMTVDTACSGSLIAMDLACRYLDSGDIDGSIVAGCNLYMSPDHNMDLRAMTSAASPSGRCWTFDERADGYIKAEAINTIILKRLDDAIRDGDPIRAVLRGSSTNSDGYTPGIASPSAEAQAAAMRRAYARAGITDIQSTAYIECHGTGTLAGDPIETKAVASVFSENRLCSIRIGSVKSNIGHSEPAAGISGALKTVLALENGIIPGNPTFERPNPNIDFEALRLAPSGTVTPWPSDMLRRASVNSFGFGGSNAHAIFEHPGILVPGYVPRGVSSYIKGEGDIFSCENDKRAERSLLFVFSANDALSLDALLKAYMRLLANPAVSIEPTDLAYTLSEKRTRHFHRGYVLSQTPSFKENQFVYGKLRSSFRPAFVFTGQGAQWPQMGRDLIQTFPVARQVIQGLDRALQRLCEPPSWFLLDELEQPRRADHIRLPEFSQPLTTALQLALLAVLEDWGIRPGMVIGHSSGEIAAATASGRLTPEEAIKVAYFRGKASVNASAQDMGMLAVGVGQLEAQGYLNRFPSVAVACINSPNSITLSGKAHDLQQLESILKREGHFARPLQVNLAYHSQYMTGMALDYLGLLEQNCMNLGSTSSSGDIAFYSTVTGELMEIGTDAEYWFSNMVCPVKFYVAMEHLIIDGGADYLIELGPSGALAGPIAQIKQRMSSSAAHIDYHATLARGDNSTRPLFELAGDLFVAGAHIDIMKVNAISSSDKPRVIFDLPNYQWNHSIKYWHESLASRDWRYRNFPVHDLLGTKIPGTSWQAPSFRRILRLRDLPWIRDHCLGSDVVFPASGYIAAAIEAMFQTAVSLELVESAKDATGVGYRLRDVRFLRALVLEEESDHHLYLFLNPNQGPKDSWYHFSIQSLRDGTWTEHSNGTIRAVSDARESIVQAHLLGPLQYPTGSYLWYKSLQHVGFNFGPAFRNLTEIEAIPPRRESRARSTWSHSGTRSFESKYAIHPTIIDSFFQAGVPPLYECQRTMIDRVFVPRIIDEINIPSRAFEVQTSIALSTCKWTRIGREDSILNYISNAQVFDEVKGQRIFELFGLRYSELLEVDPNFIKPLDYACVQWVPDFTLLRDTSLESIGSISRIADLEKDLDLSTSAVQLVALVRLKFAQISVLEIDMSQYEEYEVQTNPCTEDWGKRPSRLFISHYVVASRSPIGLANAQKRLQHLAGTRFHVYDVGSQTLLPGNDSKFDLTIIKTSRATTARDLTAVIAQAQKLASARGVLLVSNSKNTAKEPDCQSEQSHGIPFEAEGTLRSMGLPIFVKSVGRKALNVSHCAFLCSARPLFDTSTSRSDAIVVTCDHVPSKLDSSQHWLRNLGWKSLTLDEAHAQDLPTDRPIVLLDTPSSNFLKVINEEKLAMLQQLLKPDRKLLYVTSGSQIRVTSPDTALFLGLARSLRGEDQSLSLKTLDVTSVHDTHTEKVVQNVLGLFDKEESTFEVEFCEREGTIHISRLVPDERLILAELEGQIGSDLKMTWLHENPNPVRMRCERIGAMDSLQYYEVSDTEQDLRDECVEIEIQAAGLNFKDLATTMGLVPENEYQLGLEGAGVIRRVGKLVRTRCVGDRVIGFKRGFFANRVQVEPEKTLRLPDHMSFQAAATLVLVYSTAIYAFMDIHKLLPGQSVLIHSAMGGVGIASIHICRYLGAEIYATVGSDEKRHTLSERFGIPLNRIFSSRTTDFGPLLMQATNGRGVDVVLNHLTGDLLHESWMCLADKGVMLEIGKKDIVDRNLLPMEPFNRNCSYRAIDISHPSIDHDLELQIRTLSTLSHLLQAGHIQPIDPIKEFSFAEIPDAMRHMRAGIHIGKIVISDDGKDVKVPIRAASRTLRLDPDGAYLIVGGLKGLCGSLAVFLARSGAKRLVVLSRSGAEDDGSAAVMRDLSSLGTHVTVSIGDVSAAEDVKRTFSASPRPIKGIIQGAMVLRDKVFEAMTADDFHAALKPKVHGTWNIHNTALETNTELEFFTLLSSTSGIIGVRGQANYAAANTFLDAFAKYRHGLGLRAHSVNLGVIEDVGYFVRNEAALEKIESRNKFKGINERQLHMILKLSILQQTNTISKDSASQLVTGIPMPLPIDSPLLADARFSTLLLSRVVGTDALAGDATIGSASAFAQMLEAKLDRQILVKEAARLINQQLVKNLGLAADIELGRSLSSYGIDSLAAVDLRNWLRVSLKTKLTTLDVVNAANLLELAEKAVANVCGSREG
ncbi:hypothetical protein BDV96DRAFT_650896 [Lophiotrema nucula]|uniref:Uncharacterized protein n=1 Tax=Lophiotrema nucula TaxID=690887 RepID=A0A6A5YUN5_9PLEO|nr:hypothetical protein BDV96DRAFT_650896 [Lophiotrema nucula]